MTRLVTASCQSLRDPRALGIYNNRSATPQLTPPIENGTARVVQRQNVPRQWKSHNPEVHEDDDATSGQRTSRRPNHIPSTGTVLAMTRSPGVVDARALPRLGRCSSPANICRSCLKYPRVLLRCHSDAGKPDPGERPSSPSYKRLRIGERRPIACFTEGPANQPRAPVCCRRPRHFSPA